jgi:hypothetical protein
VKISNFRLGIGRPCNFPMVHMAFFDSWCTMEKPPFIYIPVDNGGIDQMREAIVIDALNWGCTHLFMMDCDMVYHPKTVPKLISHNLPLVGALCYRRYPPFDELILRRKKDGEGYELITEYEEDKLIRVDRTGTGCLLFQTKVFEKIPRPWFDFGTGKLKKGEARGEDFRFCDKARAAGYEIFVDPTVPAEHIASFKINRSFSDLYKALIKHKQHVINKKQKQEV